MTKPTAKKKDRQVAPMFTWRTAITFSDLPATTRHVLLNLALYMSEKGDSCFPSVETQAADTNLSKKSVIAHLKIAVDQGWIKVEKHGLSGQGWARNEYFAAVPPAFFDYLDTPKGGERGLPPSLLAVKTMYQKGVNEGNRQGGERGLPRQSKAVNLTAQGGEPHGKKVVNEGNPITTKDLSNNSPGDFASQNGENPKPPSRENYDQAVRVMDLYKGRSIQEIDKHLKPLGYEVGKDGTLAVLGRVA